MGEVEDLTSPCSSSFHPDRPGLAVAARQVAPLLPAFAEPAGHGESDQRAHGHQDDDHDEDELPDTRQKTSGLELESE